MERVKGTYERKSDGATFTYEVEYTPRHWEVKVRDANGDLAGSPQLGAYGQLLEGQVLRDSVVEWIERSIRDRVGVR